jgi:hypothetical protein
MYLRFPNKFWIGFTSYSWAKRAEFEPKLWNAWMFWALRVNFASGQPRKGLMLNAGVEHDVSSVCDHSAKHVSQESGIHHGKLFQVHHHVYKAYSWGGP